MQRVFISSTIHDLFDLRHSLSSELSSYGFEMLLSEQGTIPVDSTKHSYDLCLDAAKTCDVLVAVIDGRFGGTFKTSGKSITLAEIEAALDAKRKVFVFVRQRVWDAKEALRGYDKNGSDFIPSKVVDDKRVFEVIDSIRKRKYGNWIFPFNTSGDIMKILAGQLGFHLRGTVNPEFDKLDGLLARRFVAVFNEDLVKGLVHGVQIEYISEEAPEEFDDAISVFLPQTMRFVGPQSSALFNDFMHKACTLSSEMPLAFSPSNEAGFYTSKMPLSHMGTDRDLKVQEVVKLAVETLRSWNNFMTFIRTTWPAIILEIHTDES